MEELQLVEQVIREDEGVVEQCVISGIPKEDMHKVYCDRKFFNFRPFASFPCSLVLEWTNTQTFQLGRSATTRDSATRTGFNRR